MTNPIMENPFGILFISLNDIDSGILNFCLLLNAEEVSIKIG